MVLVVGEGEVPSPWQLARKKRPRIREAVSASLFSDVMATSLDVSDCSTVVSWPRGDARTQGSVVLLREILTCVTAKSVALKRPSAQPSPLLRVDRKTAGYVP